MPKTIQANLDYRQKLLKRASESVSLQQELWQECKNDLLFYLNSFSYIYEPRPIRGRKSVLPFITYPYQDDGFRELVSAITEYDPEMEQVGHDLMVEKSRDMGVTWMVLSIFDWRLRFHDYESYLITSRKEEMVEKKNNADELFWKLDFLERHMPSWLQIKDRIRMIMHVENPRTGTAIDGESTNKGLAVGGRKTAILFDENARMPNGQAISDATADVTNCRIKVSTPFGPTTSFSKECLDGKHKVWTAHWSRHPDKARGLYTVDTDGIITYLDKDYWGVEDNRKAYKFCDSQPKNHKYKFRSPWYDRKCKDRSDVDVAENLDIDHQRSQSLFFDAAEIAKLSSGCIEPMAGELSYTESGDPIGWRFTNDPLPVLAGLWFQPDFAGLPPSDCFYFIGEDTSAGTGASNSSISVWSGKARSKVAEFTASKMRPEAFACLCVAVCRWFKGPDGHPAMLAFEQNGPGRSFGQRVIELGHYKIFQKDPEMISRTEFKKIPGWFPTQANKYAMLSNYRRGLFSGEVINRCRKSLDECLNYVYLPSGAVEHVSQAGNEIDPSGAKNNHGDRAIADGLGVMLLGLKPEEEQRETNLQKEPQPFSYAWRLKQYEEKQNTESTY